MAEKVFKKDRPKVPMARVRHYRCAPRKARYVADMVRGKNVEEAVHILTFCGRRVARPMLRLVRSAMMNAEHLGDFDLDRLFVKRIQVDEGVTLKRFIPRSMGRANRIRKRTSHITVELGER